jgi:uncharacterized membrane protein YphA (DoxX/SURF4 family)
VNLLSDRRVLLVLRVAMGALFVAAAWPKLTDPTAFATSVSNYRMLPVPVERVLALVLPPLELFAGIALIVGVLDAGASVVVFSLMVVFTAAVGTALARGLDISCGCFDTEGGPKVGVAKLAENVGLTAVAWWVAFRREGAEERHPPST